MGRLKYSPWKNRFQIKGIGRPSKYICGSDLGSFRHGSEEAGIAEYQTGLWGIHHHGPFCSLAQSCLILCDPMDCITMHAAKLLQLCLTLCDPMDCSLPGSSVHGNSPGKNFGVGCHALLQQIFLIQGSNPISYISYIGRWVLYH